MNYKILLTLCVIMMVLAASVSADTWDGVYKDDTYGDDEKLHLCRINDKEVHGAYTKDGKLAGVVRGTIIPGTPERLVGLWISGGAVSGDFELTWKTNGFTGELFNHQALPGSRPETWTEERIEESVTLSQCFASQVVDPVTDSAAFNLQGKWSQGSELTAHYCTGDNFYASSYEGTTEQGVSRGKCFDHGRVCSGTWTNFKSDSSEEDEGVELFIFTEKDKFVYSSWKGLDMDEHEGIVEADQVTRDNSDAPSPDRCLGFHLKDDQNEDMINTPFNPFWSGTFLEETYKGKLHMMNHRGRVYGLYTRSTPHPYSPSNPVGIIIGSVTDDGLYVKGYNYRPRKNNEDTFATFKFQMQTDTKSFKGAFLSGHHDDIDLDAIPDGRDWNSVKQSIFSSAEETFMSAPSGPTLEGTYPTSYIDHTTNKRVDTNSHICIGSLDSSGRGTGSGSYFLAAGADKARGKFENVKFHENGRVMLAHFKEDIGSGLSSGGILYVQTPFAGFMKGLFTEDILGEETGAWEYTRYSKSSESDPSKCNVEFVGEPDEPPADDSETNAASIPAMSSYVVMVMIALVVMF